MAEFSAHRLTVSAGERVVISTEVNLYVSPFGDDVLNSGIEQGSPFRTAARAIQWLGDKYISDFGFVTINFAAGIYDIDNELVFDHYQGNRVAFVGAEADTLLLQYVSDYRTRSLTQNGYNKYYSGVYHGITMMCVRPDDNTVFASVSTANPTLICTKPAAACANRPLLPSTMFHVPLPSGKEGIELSSMASITLARRQRPKAK